MLKSCTDWVRRHPRFTLLVALELVALVVVLVIGLSQKTVIYDGSQLTAATSDVSIAEADFGYSYPAPDPAEEDSSASDEAEFINFAQLNDISLRNGMYRILVQYYGDGNGVCRFIQSKPNNVDLPNQMVHSDPAYFTPGVGTLDIPVWVTGYTNRASLSFFLNSGSIHIQAVTIAPTRIGILQVLLKWFCFFLLADLLVLMLAGWLPGCANPRTRFVLLALVGIFLLSSAPALTNYVVDGHDLRYHLQRIQGIANGLAAGQFPVRIQSNWFGASGYATSVFYCDIFLYPSAFLLQYLKLPMYLCYNLYLLAVNAITIAVSYGCFRRIFRKDWIALVGTLLYCCSLYRLSNLYVRSSLGEYTAMIFFPLVLLGLWRIFTEDIHAPGYKWCWVPFAAGFTGLFSCHMLSTEMAVMMSAICCLVLLRRTLRPATILALAKAVGFTLLGTMWFWVPFLDYTSRGTQLQTGFAENVLQAYGATLGQLLTPFANGTGYSAFLDAGARNDLPLAVGLALLAAVGLFLASWQLNPSASTRDSDSRAMNKAGLLCLFLGLGCCCLATCYFPWSWFANLSLLNNIATTLQFPWRFLGPAVFLLSAVAGFALWSLREQHRALRLGAGALLSVLALISASWLLTSTMYSQDPLFISTGDPVSYYSDNFYLLKGMSSGGYSQSIEGSDGVSVSDRQRSNTTVQATVTAEADGTLEVPLYAYPYYRAEDIATGEELPIVWSDVGQISIPLTAGYSGTIRVHFVQPLLWKIATLISLLFWICTAVMYLRSHKKRLSAA